VAAISFPASFRNAFVGLVTVSHRVHNAHVKVGTIQEKLLHKANIRLLSPYLIDSAASISTENVGELRLNEIAALLFFGQCRCTLLLTLKMCVLTCHDEICRSNDFTAIGCMWEGRGCLCIVLK